MMASDRPMSPPAPTQGDDAGVAPLPALTRREHLSVERNPDPSLDYLIERIGVMALPHIGRVRLIVRYVPDRLVITPDGFGTYCTALSASGLASLEALATAALGDVANEAVPRWHQVHVETVTDDSVNDDGNIAGAQCSARVTAEDSQPNWQNAGLIARLKPL